MPLEGFLFVFSYLFISVLISTLWINFSVNSKKIQDIIKMLVKKNSKLFFIIINSKTVLDKRKC